MARFTAGVVPTTAALAAIRRLRQILTQSRGIGIEDGDSLVHRRTVQVQATAGTGVAGPVAMFEKTTHILYAVARWTGWYPMTPETLFRLAHPPDH